MYLGTSGRVNFYRSTGWSMETESHDLSQQVASGREAYECDWKLTVKRLGARGKSWYCALCMGLCNGTCSSPGHASQPRRRRCARSAIPRHERELATPRLASSTSRPAFRFRGVDPHVSSPWWKLRPLYFTRRPPTIPSPTVHRLFDKVDISLWCVVA